jgi:outer membrane immunogenic protein
MNRRVLFAVASSLLISGSAIAADMRVKAPVPVVAAAYNWTGFYGGINYGWDRERIDWTYTNPVPFIPPHALSGDTGILGGHIGYQYQWQQFVFGVEGALSLPTNGAFAGFVPCAPAASPTSQCQARVSSLRTLGGRLGWTTGSWLFFGTGGWATANVSTRELTVPPAVFDVSQIRRHDGGYVGAGVEYGVTANLIVGVEYQHVSLNTLYHASSADAFGPSPPGVNGRNIAPTMDIVRARVSLKLP